MTIDDKDIERERYNKRATKSLSNSIKESYTLGSQTMPLYLQPPYLFYEKAITKLVNKNNKVLEIGAGTGMHTLALINTGAEVIATDISPDSLIVLQNKVKSLKKTIISQIADMESLPFPDNSFDVVTCAGSLSYGEPTIVNKEIKRVLRQGGTLICVDSLNHNPVFRINRWIHYLRSNRSKSTLIRMPTLKYIQELSNNFSIISVNYFGALTFLAPIMIRIFSQEKTRDIINYFDNAFKTKKTAFKFVLIAQNFQK